jgi:hypothetical protein
MVFTIKKHIQLTIIAIFLIAFSGFAQTLEGDTILVDSAKVKFHSPTKATLMSMVVPGLGQVYNRKYWKLPIIYGGIGTSLYFAFSNHKEYKRFKDAYIIRIDSDTTTFDEFDGILTPENIRSNMDVYRRNRDFSYIIAGLIYVFNIIDATVDAHLFTFPVNDNLTFYFQPSIQLTNNNNFSKGFTLIITL